MREGSGGYNTFNQRGVAKHRNLVEVWAILPNPIKMPHLMPAFTFGFFALPINKKKEEKEREIKTW